MRIFTIFLLLSTLVFGQLEGDAPLITQISTTNMVEGEAATFNLIFRDRKPSKTPSRTLTADGLTIRYRGASTQYINGDGFYIYQYLVIAQKAGSFKVPSFEFESKGKKLHSNPANINVVSQDSLNVERFESKGEELVCYSKLFINKSSLYPGESTNLEYKIYLPRKLTALDWGQPKADQAFNCTAWRFDNPGRGQNIGEAQINNQSYRVGSYSTVLSALKAGDASFGPMESILTVALGAIDPFFGASRRNRAELPITSPALEINVLPFPEAAPEGFTGAVGNYTIEADFSSETTINLNDSITATVSIEGQGDIHSLEAPTLEDSAFWTVIDVSKVEQGEERKQLNGSTQFTYILQPKRGAETFPRFTFVHFNPDKKKFFTDTTGTTAITLEETQATSSVILPNTPAQVENMQDILAPLASVKLTANTPSLLSTIPAWSWHLVPASLLFLILIKAASTSLQKKRQSSTTSESKTQQLELNELKDCKDEDFLKLAGAYSEKWISNTPEALSIQQLRDNQCYQPANSEAVEKKQRKDILNTLKKLSLLLVLSLCCLSTNTQAAESDDSFTLWQKGDHKAALDSYLAEIETNPESADLLYNVGSCYYRLNQPGLAALYFQRALSLAPSHHEAAKNLEFTQKIQAAIQPKTLTQFEQLLVNLPATFYKNTAISFAWILLLTGCYLKLLKPKGGRFGWNLTAAILSPILALLCLYGWLEHPEHKVSSAGSAAVITKYTAVLTEPIEVSGKELEKKTLINAAPSSDCRLLATRDIWSYEQLANGTRGWVPTNKVEAL